MKKCPHCKILKLDNEFPIRKDNGKEYLDWLCKLCMLEYNRNYRKKDVYKQNVLKRKLDAYRMIQKDLKCVRCGCDDIRFLEINHINGGGTQEQKSTKLSGMRLYTAIFYGKRKTDDLELLCKPCNHIHYLELKYGKIGLKVIWEP